MRLGLRSILVRWTDLPVGSVACSAEAAAGVACRVRYHAAYGSEKPGPGGMLLPVKRRRNPAPSDPIEEEIWPSLRNGGVFNIHWELVDGSSKETWTLDFWKKDLRPRKRGDFIFRHDTMSEPYRVGSHDFTMVRGRIETNRAARKSRNAWKIWVEEGQLRRIGMHDMLRLEQMIARLRELL